tara:strand:- start:4791 stop:6788 length:1998 start_codon:yes stop_codon:yes gene_type:complete
MKRRLVSLVFLASAMIPAAVHGQGGGGFQEIVVTSPRNKNRVDAPQQTLEFETLQEYQPVAAADIFRNFTGISLRTNSRGESVIRIRGAEERQTLIFLDGAPLATPWDGRADLAMLPAALIDRIELTRGVMPIEYGANAVAGAVDLYSLQPDSGAEIRAEAQYGSLGVRNLSAVVGVGAESGWSFVAGASQIGRDAERIADRSSVPFDPAESRSRTNTDLAGNSGYLAAGYSGEVLLVRASVLHADVERGIAAQGDLDPELSSPRFWRTPDWLLTQATFNTAWFLPGNTELRFTGWRQWFEQQIDAYRDNSYTTLEAREAGSDDTTGGRLTLARTFDRATLRLVSTAQESTHDNQEFEFDTDGSAVLTAGPILRYRQRLLTVGAEADIRISDALVSTFGLARDRAVTPLTGDKPVQPSFAATGWSAGLQWSSERDWVFSGTLGERSRFPTPRELYGAALGKFLINPELRPERSLLADVNIKRTTTKTMSLEFSIWANDSKDTLSQRSVMVDGESRRQRYNTNGAFTYGVEAGVTLHLAENFRTEFSAALQDGKIDLDNNGERPELLQRPKSQLKLALDWQATSRADLRAEFLYTGTAYDMADDGTLRQLPKSTSINLRSFFQLAEWDGRKLELTASIDNLTDAVIVPQLGLPQPGRMARVGLRFN